VPDNLSWLLCGDWHLADDLVQETLAKAFRHWRRVQGADSPDAYVHRILINEVNRHWQRHRNAAPPVNIGADEIIVPDVSDEVIDRVDLLQALWSLPVRQRSTVVLRYLAGMSERETAAVLRCSEGTVKSQTSRADHAQGLPEARGIAAMTLQTEEQLSAALHDIAAAQPFVPDLAAIRRRGLRLRRRATVVRGAVGVGVVAAAAVLTVTTIGSPATTVHQAGGHPHESVAAKGKAPVGSPLVSLADDITADTGQPVGDATLVLRDQSCPGQASIGAADLYTDSGKYYFAHDKSGLPAQIAAHHDQGGGLFAREVAAAIYGVTGDLTVAREQMADAPNPGAKPSRDRVTDNYIWEDSLDAINAGAGNPAVRAGVLRILSTVPAVTVANTTTDGTRTLTLTASSPAFGGSNYQETLTINANNGVPIMVTGGIPGQRPDVTVTYQVTRVTLADVAAG
jgi:RNA polymerase sigma factor (sigma-70 family)